MSFGFATAATAVKKLRPPATDRGTKVSDAATLICGVAISIAGRRIDDVAYSEFDWPSAFPAVLIFGLACLWLFRRVAREQEHNLSGKRQLEALLKQLDGQ